jgi:hypothetical protein
MWFLLVSIFLGILMLVKVSGCQPSDCHSGVVGPMVLETNMASGEPLAYMIA